MNNPFNMSSKIALIIAGVALLCAFAFVGFMTLRDHQRAGRIVELQNEIAKRDNTIEVQNGVYQKLALQTKDLTELLDKKDVQLLALQEQLKKQGSELLTANTIVVKLRKDLQDKQEVAVIITNPEKPGIKNVNIDTKARLDPFQIRGNVEIDCDNNKAKFNVSLDQRSPIKFSVAVSQDSDGTWRSSATSSTKAFEVDIALAAVNPYLLEPKWYEKIGVGLDVGVSGSPGILAGVGVSYEIGKFEVGPKAWFTAQPQGVSPFFGAQLTWHPFKKIH